jgi:hypothetical protein
VGSEKQKIGEEAGSTELARTLNETSQIRAGDPSEQRSGAKQTNWAPLSMQRAEGFTGRNTPSSLGGGDR